MLSTDNEMVRDIVLAVMASLAKIERQKISERTRAGMERVRQHARRSGGHQSAIGRPDRRDVGGRNRHTRDGEGGRDGQRDRPSYRARASRRVNG